MNYPDFMEMNMCVVNSHCFPSIPAGYGPSVTKKDPLDRKDLFLHKESIRLTQIVYVGDKLGMLVTDFKH